MILLNSKKVASGEAEIKNISIARDLTVAERQDYKDKVKAIEAELVERTNHGETGLERRGLRICKAKEPGLDSGEDHTGGRPPFQ